jgi:ATP-dependent DNA helicase RecQ
VFPDVPIAAFTATATPRVAEDIVNRLKLKNPHLTRASFNRPNLFYQVIYKRGFDNQLLDFVNHRPDESGIVYRTSRKKVEETATFLQSQGHSALPYHAGMSDTIRHTTQEAFRCGECAIIVATIAFGMGIDKSNVRFVVHGDLPKNIEGYYQETGRAGRDGEPARCTLFYGRQDVAVLAHFANEIEDEHAREIAKEQLRQMVRFAEQDECRRIGLLRYFGEEYPKAHCGHCDICTGHIEREDATIAAQKVLSAIYRTGERFGASHVCDVIVGEETDKVRQFRHDQLPTFGIGKDRPKTYWRTVAGALVTQNILAVDDPQFPVLKLTNDAWAILRSKQRFEMISQQPQRLPKFQKSRVIDIHDAHSAQEINPLSESLFLRLRELRKEIATAENVPSFVVFSDKVLREMSIMFPKDREAFLRINGIGRHKLETYGDAFLAAINEFCQMKSEHEPEHEPEHEA